MMTRKQLKARRMRKAYEHDRNVNNNNVKRELRKPPRHSLGRSHTYRFYNI